MKVPSGAGTTHSYVFGGTVFYYYFASLELVRNKISDVDVV